MSTYPVDVTTDWLVGAFGTIRALGKQELGRDVFAEPFSHADPACAIMTIMALEGWTGAQLEAWLHEQPEAVAYRTRTLPAIVVEGQHFRLESGERFTAIECSDFHLFARYQAGENIEPILTQRAQAGFNLLRVWTLYDVAGIGTLRDPDYAKIPGFLALCARYGLYVEFTAYVQPELADPSHWTHLIAASLLSRTRPLLELVNENDQHPIDLSPFQQAPDPLLSSHGSNGSEHQPVLPHWSYAAMHFNDASEWQRKCGHNAMEVWSGPTLANENTRAADRFTSPDLAFDAAAGAALLCAGSCFHSVHGKTSELWDADELALAQAWVAGAHSVPLECQDGGYVHRQDLETPDLLRVYQRGSSDTCVVRIRK